MSTLHKLVLSAILLGGALLAGCEKGADAKKGVAPVATVNGKPITQEAYDAYAQQRAISRHPTGDPAEREATIQELINRELIYQDAVKQGLDKRPDVLAEIENQKRNVLAGYAVRNFVNTHPLTDEEMRKEYESRMGGMTTREYKARHILVDDQAQAKALIARLDKGEDFSKLARENSKDGSAQDGGDIGWFEIEGVVSGFREAVEALEKGKYTKEPAQSQYGWHVIVLDDTREIAPPEFDKVKENVRNIMQNRQIEKYLADLKSAAKIEIKGEQPAAPGVMQPGEKDEQKTE
jgi:peptidyl-prolyl cis-trans isomerase C